VLIVGAPGTGRTIAARYLHHASGISDLRQVVGMQIDLAFCAEIAQPKKTSRRITAGEIILIDAVETIPAEIQPRLAHAIEEGIAAGGPRIVAIAEESPGTSKCLSQELLEVISAITVRMPTLAERQGEKLALAQALLALLAARMRVEPPCFEEGAKKLIETELWPGNLRQMRAVLISALDANVNGAPISAALIVTQLARLSEVAASQSAPPGKASTSVGQMLEIEGFSLVTLERDLYGAAIERARGNLSAAARMLGLTRAQLAYRIDSAALKNRET
jgi:DNA-binding NtrC family response regulator